MPPRPRRDDPAAIAPVRPSHAPASCMVLAPLKPGLCEQLSRYRRRKHPAIDASTFRDSARDRPRATTGQSGPKSFVLLPFLHALQQVVGSNPTAGSPDNVFKSEIWAKSFAIRADVFLLAVSRS